jgi:hypothetical protein
VWWVWKETRHAINFAGMAGFPAGRLLDVAERVAIRGGVIWDGEAIEYFNLMQDAALRCEVKRQKREEKRPGK